MTAPNTDAITRRYMSRLKRELEGFPSSYRDEITEDIREHIAESQGECSTDAELQAMLDRLGAPRAIADEARQRFDLPPVRASITDVAALVLIALSVSVVGYLVAVLLVWRSAAWTVRDKVVATVLPALGLGLGVIAASHLQGSHIAVGLVAGLLFIATPVYLAVRLRNKSPWLTAAVAVVAAIVVVPLLIVALLSAAVVGGHQVNSVFSVAPSVTPSVSGYEYALSSGARVCSTVNAGAAATVPCDTIPAPAAGWTAVQAATSGYCGASCIFVAVQPSTTLTCTQPSSGSSVCRALVPTFAPSPEATSHGR